MMDNRSLYVDAYEGCDQKISEALNRMTFSEKNILVLRIYEEKTYEEIAYIIKKGQSASRKQYERARKKFIKLYNQENVEEHNYGNRKQLENVF